jgi:protocatechuate 3,4-dioxygenase beta subunit
MESVSQDRTPAPHRETTAPSRPVEPTEVAALIDKAGQALRTGSSDSSAILSDPRYLSVHAWPRFRDLIRNHAASSITIVTPQEPGRRLRVRLRLINADGTPSAGSLIYFYHTDARGDYGPNDAGVPLAGSDNNYARLFGYATTDSDGTIQIQTIRPGGYPDDNAPEHIHLRIWCRDQRSFGGEIWFDDDPRVSREARQEAARGRIAICPVATDAQGHASIDARIRLD